MLCPSPGRAWLASKTINWPTTGAVGENWKSAVGALPAPTRTAVVVEAWTPPVLVTVSVTLNVPFSWNVWLGCTPDPNVPSPKFHTKFVMPAVLVQADEPAQLADASNSVCCLADGVVGEKENFAVGVTAGGRITPGGTSRIVTDCD